MNTHKTKAGGEDVLCKRVPSFMRKSEDWNQVTCKWCLKLKGKETA